MFFNIYTYIIFISLRRISSIFIDHHLLPTSLSTTVTLGSHQLHMLLSRPPLQCRMRSAKQFHSKQWKIFGYCFFTVDSFFAGRQRCQQHKRRWRPRKATVCWHFIAELTFFVLLHNFSRLFGMPQKTPRRHETQPDNVRKHVKGSLTHGFWSRHLACGVITCTSTPVEVGGSCKVTLAGEKCQSTCSQAR